MIWRLFLFHSHLVGWKTQWGLPVGSWVGSKPFDLWNGFHGSVSLHGRPSSQAVTDEMDPVFRKHWPIRLLLVQTMLMERYPWPRSDWSSPWPVASLQVPLLEFLPGMGRFMLCLSPVFPCLQYQLYYHQGQRQNDRQIKRRNQRDEKRVRGWDTGKGLLPVQFEFTEDKRQRCTCWYKRADPGPKDSSLPLYLVYPSPPDSPSETFIECLLHVRPQGYCWKETKQEHKKVNNAGCHDWGMRNGNHSPRIPT